MSDLTRRGMLQALGAAGLGAVGLSACRTDSEAEGVESARALLELWTHDPGYASFFTEAAEAGLVEGSSWTYDVNVTNAAQEDIMTRLITQAVAGRPLPDMAGIDVDQFPRAMRSEIAENLFVDLTALTDEHGEGLLRTEAYSSDGRVYAIESDNCISVMWYRQDLFQERGIPEDVETWEEMLEIGAEVAADTGEAIGMVSNSGSGAIVQTFGQLLLQRGGHFYDEGGELAVVSDEAVDALELMAEGVRTGAFLSLSDPYGGATAAALNDGRLMSMVMPNWYEVYGLQANVPDQEGLWRARTIPRFSGGGHIATTAGGTAFSVVRDQELTEAAVDFLHRTYLTPEGQLARYHAGAYLPTLVDLYDTPEFQEITSDFLGGQRIFEVYAEAAEDLPPYHQSENALQMREVFAGPLLNAIHGQVAPEDALEAAADDYHRQVRE